MGDHDGAAVLGRVADDRDDHDRDEELVEPDRVAEWSSEWTRISETNAVASVAPPSSASERLQRPRAARWHRARSRARWIRRLRTVITR